MGTPQSIRDRVMEELEALARLRTLDPAFLITIKAMADEDFLYLGQSIDDSDYSAQEWLIALHEFWQWQTREGQRLSPRFQIEYLNCCAEGSVRGGGKLVSLADLFHDYAKLYGVKSTF